ncbi:MAG: flagellar type III secretion system protein FlhB [Holosporales bacterium]|jgi:flagellar biosynthetic protein FlhB|nr:flagellar type III secretion system protein FlhB [Holosporales bacterium]
MAEEQNNEDASQKIFEATEHRLRQAREEGKIPISHDFSVAWMVLAAAFVLLVLGPHTCIQISNFLTPFFEQTHSIRLTPNTVRDLFIFCSWRLGKALAFMGGTFLLMALLGTAMQTRFSISWNRLKLDVSRLSLKQGRKRLFSWKACVEFFKNCLKFFIASLLVIQILKKSVQGGTALVDASPLQWLFFTRIGLFKMFLYVLIFIVVLGGLDYWYQWFLHRRELRMTRQEMKEELKQTEGNPQTRAQIRHLRGERARKQVVSTLQDATVLITDAKLYAIALKYDAENMATPIVTAKGTEAYAKILQNFAYELGLPVVEHPFLAQALCTSVRINQHILPEHYRDVAAIMRYIAGKKAPPSP